MAGKQMRLVLPDVTWELLEKIEKETGARKASIIAMAVAEYAKKILKGDSHNEDK